MSLYRVEIMTPSDAHFGKCSLKKYPCPCSKMKLLGKWGVYFSSGKNRTIVFGDKHLDRKLDRD